MTPDDQLVSRIRDEIYSGGLRPGEWLKQADVVDRYEVSGFMARKALQALNDRGLLRHEKFRGYRVALPSEKELRHLKQVRCILETGAVAEIVANATPDAIADLRSRATAFRDSIDSLDPLLPRRLNAEFHDSFYALAGNAVLSEMIRTTRERQVPGALDIWISARRMQDSARDHFAMVDAVEGKDIAGLAVLIRHHILRDIREFDESSQQAGAAG